MTMLAMLPSVVAHLALGTGAGLLYFGSLWWNARLFARAGRIRPVITSIAARFVLLGGVLFAVSLEGAMPLLVTALGILAGRFVVLRRARAAMP